MDPGNLIRPLSNAFADWHVIFGICSALVLWATYLIWRSSRPYSRIKSLAREANAVLNSDSPFSELLSKLEALKPSHLRDRLKWELSDTEIVDERRYRLLPNQEPFEALLPDFYDIRTFEAWPNVFVGIGLLLTFLGLALSLANASYGAASGDIAVVKQSVTTLLEFSAAKFSMSLVALLCSLVIGYALRKQRHGMEDALRTVERSLDNVVPHISLQRILWSQGSKARRREDLKQALAMFFGSSEAKLAMQSLEELRNASSRARREEDMTAALALFFEARGTQIALQNLDDLLSEAKEQLVQLSLFNSSLAIQFGEALDNKLHPMLEHLTDRVETALRQMGGSMQESNQDALTHLLDSFIKDFVDRHKPTALNYSGAFKTLPATLSAHPATCRTACYQSSPS